MLKMTPDDHLKVIRNLTLDLVDEHNAFMRSFGYAPQIHTWDEAKDLIEQNIRRENDHLIQENNRLKVRLSHDFDIDMVLSELEMAKLSCNRDHATTQDILRNLLVYFEMMKK